MSHFTGLDHIDIVVDDIERMAEFLLSIGFSEIRRTDHNGGAIELRFPGGDSQPILELTSANGAGRAPFALGLRHMALRCADLDNAYAVLSAEGFQFTGAPKLIPHTGRRLTNIKDPENGVMQICD